MCEKRIFLTHVQERDVDLLLIEELWSNLGFQRWFLKEIWVNPDYPIEGTQRGIGKYIEMLKSSIEPLLEDGMLPI